MGHEEGGTANGSRGAVLIDALAQRLMELLGQEHERVLQLLKQAKQKNAALLADDLRALEQIVAAETAWLQEFEGIEQQRTELLERIQVELKDLGVRSHGDSPYTLENVAEYTSDTYREKLLRQGQGLKDALVELQELNVLNAELLTHSIALTNFSLGLLTGGTGPVTYGEPGKRQPISPHQSRLDARA